MIIISQFMVQIKKNYINYTHPVANVEFSVKDVLVINVNTLILIYYPLMGKKLLKSQKKDEIAWRTC